MTDAEMDALSAGAATSNTLTDDDIDRLSAAPVASPAPPAQAAPPKPGFFRSAFDTVSGGIHNLGAATKDQAMAIAHTVMHPRDSFGSPEGRADTASRFALTNPAKRHEIERGVSDVATLGYAQKAAEFADRKTHEWWPQTFNLHMAPDQVEADARAAPAYRTVGQVGALGMTNPLGEVGGVVADVAGATATRFAPRAASSVMKIAQALGRAPVVGGTAKALGTYEANAPAQAALSADAGGHRLEAAKAAALDPAGVLVSGLAGGVAGPLGAKVLASKGAQARQFIEREGGAKVGPFTPGRGGVYDSELRGVPTNDAGIGEARTIGGRNVVGDIELRHELEHGYPYRGGHEMVSEATNAKKAGAEDRRIAITVAKEARNANVDQARSENLAETAQRAKKLIADNAHEKKVMASEPYRVLKEQLESKPEVANAPQDATSLMTTMGSAVYDAETSDFAGAKLQSVMNKMERYRDKNGKVMVPARQLNGFRKNLMDAAKVGHSDVAGKAEAPLRQAAYEARDLANQGPYAPLNALFAEGAKASENARRAVGLPARPGKDKLAEREKLTMRLRKGITDPSMIPGEDVPAEADLSPLREKMSAAKTSARPAIEKARAEAADQRAKVEDAVARKARGDKGALADRKLLGLTPGIGTHETDINQVGLKLSRESGDSEAAGASQADLDAYRAAHPDQRRSTFLPDLLRKRGDLQFRIDSPEHKGLFGRLTKGLIATVKQNAEPITGRLLYGPAQRIDAQRTAMRIGRLLGATEARRKKEQQP